MGINLDNYTADWTMSNEDAGGHRMTVANVELNSQGSRRIAGLFAGDRVQFSMMTWIVHEIDRTDPERVTLVLRAASATDPPNLRR